MSKRTNGTGSVYRDTKRNRWIGEVVIEGRRRRTSAKTKVDASAAIVKMISTAERGEVVTDGRKTVGDALTLWRDRTLKNRRLEPSSRENYDWALRNLTAEFAKVRLRTLDVARIERGFDHIATGAYGRGKPVSHRSLKLFRSTLVQALEVAVRHRWIGSNPATHAEITPTAPKTVARRALDHDGAQALWDALEGERLGPMFRLMLLTGLRPGEALGVCWDAVDFDTGRLAVRRGVRMERGRARLVETLKTDAAFRTVSLPEPAIEVLHGQRVAVAELKLAARTWAVDDPGLVFPTVNGGPWNPKNAREELRRICEGAGIEYVRPHELRHTAATILNDRGVPLELIADLLGHADVTTLARVYRHRIRPSADAAVETMNAMFSTS